MEISAIDFSYFQTPYFWITLVMAALLSFVAAFMRKQ